MASVTPVTYEQLIRALRAMHFRRDRTRSGEGYTVFVSPESEAPIILPVLAAATPMPATHLGMVKRLLRELGPEKVEQFDLLLSNPKKSRNAVGQPIEASVEHAGAQIGDEAPSVEGTMADEKPLDEEPMRMERANRGESATRNQSLVDFVVKVRRSARVVEGCRQFGFNALVVVGDRKGRVSYGYSRANEVPPAVEKAIKEGEANVNRQKKISLHGTTIPHRVIGKYRACKVILVPAGPGTGVKAAPGVREVLQACGVTNVLTEVYGSTNPLNLVKATIQGLLQLRTREEVVALRGVAL